MFDIAQQFSALTSGLSIIPALAVSSLARSDASAPGSTTLPAAGFALACVPFLAGSARTKVSLCPRPPSGRFWPRLALLAAWSIGWWPAATLKKLRCNRLLVIQCCAAISLAATQKCCYTKQMPQRARSAHRGPQTERLHAMPDSRLQARLTENYTDAATNYATASMAALSEMTASAMSFWLPQASPNPKPAGRRDHLSWYDGGRYSSSRDEASDMTNPWAGLNMWTSAMSTAMQPSTSAPAMMAMAMSFTPFAMWWGYAMRGPTFAWPMAYTMIASGVPESVAWPTAEANAAVLDAPTRCKSSCNRPSPVFNLQRLCSGARVGAEVGRGTLRRPDAHGGALADGHDARCLF